MGTPVEVYVVIYEDEKEIKRARVFRTRPEASKFFDQNDKAKEIMFGELI